jgi:hypothetical protein
VRLGKWVVSALALAALAGIAAATLRKELPSMKRYIRIERM